MSSSLDAYQVISSSPLFDAAFYLNANPDVAAAGIDPVTHYLNYGGRERRNPHPQFDSDAYLRQCEQMGERPENPLLHYITTGAALGLKPLRFELHEASNWPSASDHKQVQSLGEIAAILDSALFDLAFYNSAHGLQFGSIAEGVEDYVLVRASLGRDPNLYFHSQWYLDKYPDVSKTGVNPFFHYLVQGFKEDRQPSLLFDPVWYKAHYGVPEGENPLAHFYQRRTTCTVSPIPDFDVEFYARGNPDVRAAGIDPFEHFLLYGYKEMRNPSANFDLKYYRRRYLGTDRKSNPFIHFLQHRHEPGIYGKYEEVVPSIPRSTKRYSRPGPEFEELKPASSVARPRAKVLAYYLPQFHTFLENDRWWGKGFTEWTNLMRGMSRFEGHYQPRVPRDLGFYSLDGNDTLRRQVEFAKAGGVHGFVYYYYWFDGKRLMEKPLDNLLADPSIEMPFCLMWANENWTRRWDGAESEVLISQQYRTDCDARLIADFARHFRDKRYIRIQGRPLAMIYRPGLIPNTARTLDRWRKLFEREAGENPIFVMAQAFGAVEPKEFGFDGAIEFPPHKLTNGLPTIENSIEWLDWGLTASVYRYEDVVERSLSEPKPSYPLIKTVVPSWDNDARRQGAGLVITGSTPEKYQRWLSELIARAVETPFFGEPMVCVNAWNEWCESAYLEPDQYFGSAYLNATARAVYRIQAGPSQAKSVLLVGHDAFPSGAQQLLLNIGRLLKRRFGMAVEFLLLGGGELENAYREVAPTTVATSDDEIRAFTGAAAKRDIRRAIANTVVSGRAIGFLKAAGIEAISLVHELAGVIRRNHLQNQTLACLENASQVIFAAATVRDQVCKLMDMPIDDRMLLIPQGCYKAIAYNAEAARGIRSELGILAGEHLVIGMGHADLRKGFDLFVQLWRLFRSRTGSRVHFCWAGGINPDLATSMATEIEEARESGTFHTTGFRADVEALLSAADVFVLTSREDPFPTVVHEALSVGLPVVAFDKAGGMSDFLRDTNMGSVVAHCDVPAMASSLLAEFEKGISETDRQVRKQFVVDNLDFGGYVETLLHLLFPELVPVSVAVPNYNYAAVLPERLQSIFAQSYPVYETLVLDDCSKDNSLEVIRTVAEESDREIRLVPSETNSGSVFRQWRKSAEMTSGEYLWIAEADDLSEPAFLSDLMALMAQDKNIAFGFTDSCALNPDGSVLWESYKGYYQRDDPTALAETGIFDGREFAARHLSVRNLILNVSAVVWRRDALLRALDACWPELMEFRMAGDWRLYLEALAGPAARVAYVATPLNKHRRHAASVTHALDVDKHVAEIARCHSAVARMLDVSGEIRKAQAHYIAEVSGQLKARTTERKSAQKAAGPKKKSRTGKLQAG